jgi:hypothetical protein
MSSVGKMFSRVKHLGPNREERKAILARWSGIGRRKQIVVCGFPRAGTSLLYNMLCTCLPNFEADDFEAPAARSIGRWVHHLSKWPMDVIELPTIVQQNRLNKDLHAIIMIRDPRDILTSVHPNVPDDYFCRYKWRWSPQQDEEQTVIQDDRGIERIASAIEDAKRLRGVTVHVVHYESLIADPGAIQERLRRGLGVKFDGRFDDFHTRPERHRYRYDGCREAKDKSLVRENGAIETGRVAKWKKPVHCAHLKEQFEAHPELFELVRRYGYENDDGWFEQIKAVERAGGSA